MSFKGFSNTSELGPHLTREKKLSPAYLLLLGFQMSGCTDVWVEKVIFPKVFTSLGRDTEKGDVREIGKVSWTPVSQSYEKPGNR